MEHLDRFRMISILVSMSVSTVNAARTHVDAKVLRHSAAVFPQHAEGHALLQEDAHFVLVLEFNLQSSRKQETEGRWKKLQLVEDGRRENLAFL